MSSPLIGVKLFFIVALPSDPVNSDAGYSLFSDLLHCGNSDFSERKAALTGSGTG